ncbi:5'-nucleotidase [Nitratireductor thuwali]|uniref:5'-nucleotidase n=1 Tax=Nitratireductor thuwali TaxID=2267699 RepID=A0ABY5MCM0_9HYPH|nr:5'-nucleotidase [Nitratireductor thuwali]
MPSPATAWPWTRSSWSLSKLETYSVHIVEHFGLARFFHTVHGSAHDGTNADKPDLIAHILQAEPLDPVRTVTIGDRSHDIAGARANGIMSLGVLWGFGDRKELADAGADEIVERPSDLAAAVDRLLQDEVLSAPEGRLSCATPRRPLPVAADCREWKPS